MKTNILRKISILCVVGVVQYLFTKFEFHLHIYIHTIKLIKKKCFIYWGQ